jgi:hypothetical protein
LLWIGIRDYLVDGAAARGRVVLEFPEGGEVGYEMLGPLPEGNRVKLKPTRALAQGPFVVAHLDAT